MSSFCSSPFIHIPSIIWCWHVCAFLLALMVACDRYFRMTRVLCIRCSRRSWFLSGIFESREDVIMSRWSVETSRNFWHHGFWRSFWSIAISYLMSTSYFFVRLNPRTGWRTISVKVRYLETVGNSLWKLNPWIIRQSNHIKSRFGIARS